MSDPNHLDRELREYLEKEPNLRREDRLVYLKTIFNKQSDISNLEHLITNKDYFDLVAGAKSQFTNLAVPLYITNKQVESGEVRLVAIMESLLVHLNKSGLLKRLVKFDYTSIK